MTERGRCIGASGSWLAVLATVALSPPGAAQEVQSQVEPPRTVDRSFRPEIPDPAYAEGAGPTVCVDEAHNNFHTAVGTYWPFAEALRRDGFVVTRAVEPAVPALLAGCRIYVMADVQPPAEPGDPPTIGTTEVATIRAWVEGGGSLLLITDHQPDPGAIAELAGAFGIDAHNGYVLNGGRSGTERPIVFRRSDGRIADHVVTEGVDVVATFTGSAFRVPAGFSSILTFGPGRRSWTPAEYWRFPPGTPSTDVSGWSQGAVGEIGNGRIAVFGEAAMFTAQVFDQGRLRAGMNAQVAEDNFRLLRNVVHWLAGVR